MIDCSIKASIIAAENGNQFLWEHPEHLGLAADGLVPASIWELPELLDVLARFHAITFALFQCQYGAPTSKPTRFLTSLSAFLSSPPQYSGLPRLDAQGRYVGPLPKTCPHGSHEGLIGKDPSTKGWRRQVPATLPSFATFLPRPLPIRSFGWGVTRAPHQQQVRKPNLTVSGAMRCLLQYHRVHRLLL